MATAGCTNSRFVCCLDLGTSAIKGALIDADGVVHRSHRSEAPPHDIWHGFLSFDPQRYVDAVLTVLRALGEWAATENVTVAALGLTNQRATLTPLGTNHTPCGPALSWQDTSAAPMVPMLGHKVTPSRFAEITGLPPFTALSVFRLMRLRNVCGNAFGDTAVFAELQGCVLSRLGGGPPLVDPSNAATFGLMDVRQLAWSHELLAAVGMEQERLPPVHPATSKAGELRADVARAVNLPEKLPLILGGGDRQCATLGSGATDAGHATLDCGTAGTVSCVLSEPATDLRGRLFCLPHVIPQRWVLEGFLNCCGGALTWAASILGARTEEELAEMASAAPAGANGLTFIPHLTGAGAPDFRPDATGIFAGIGLAHTRKDMARAVLEGVAFELKRILDEVARHVPLTKIYFSGNALGSPFGQQLLSNTLDRPVTLLADVDAGLRGMAAVVWAGLGRYESAEAAIQAFRKPTTTVASPGEERAPLARAYETYRDRVRRYMP